MRKILILSLALFSSLGCVFASSATPIHRDPVKSPVVRPQVPENDKNLIILNDFYARDDQFVYAVNADKSAWQKIPVVEYSTFTVLGGQFARDTHNIFQRGSLVKGADMKTFTIISAEH